ncbi:MAG: GTPase HflX [Kiloniellales bacterium]|nr:GTPase HflX [Kiloniellales bacterium]
MRALVLRPELRGTSADARSPEARLDEAVGLAVAIDLEIVARRVVRVPRLRPATLLGGGAVEEIACLVEAEAVEVAVVDASLTPVQQRNLERAWHCKVIDRTGLILEIFGERARTREGKLQVELAALSYQRSRLVRSWTHLERQRGGFGFLGGPGESQLEIDRRLITERISRIKADLAQVVRTRSLHRQARRRVPYPIVALVGYTNAGKSTLFNRLTEAEVTAKDMLFATLDPTMRRVTLPSGTEVILSDTVGFVSDLPPDLVAAFRATLEEVTEADIVVHVRDISHPDSDAQCADVLEVLRDLGLGAQVDEGLIEALNKIDLLTEEARQTLITKNGRRALGVPLSAATGEGVEALLDAIDRQLAAARTLARLSIPLVDGAALAWLYRHGQVVERRDDESHAHVQVRLRPEDRALFERRRQEAAAEV